MGHKESNQTNKQRLAGENFKKGIFFSYWLPFENLDIESMVSQKLLQPAGASNLDSW